MRVQSMVRGEVTNGITNSVGFVGTPGPGCTSKHSACVRFTSHTRHTAWPTMAGGVHAGTGAGRGRGRRGEIRGEGDGGRGG